jgi:hypothetical protein
MPGDNTRRSDERGEHLEQPGAAGEPAGSADAHDRFAKTETNHSAAGHQRPGMDGRESTAPGVAEGGPHQPVVSGGLWNDRTAAGEVPDGTSNTVILSERPLGGFDDNEDPSTLVDLAGSNVDASPEAPAIAVEARAAEDASETLDDLEDAL